MRPYSEEHAVCPLLQFLNEAFANEDALKRDEDIGSETFHPAILHCAQPVSVCSLALEIAKQARINPARTHFRQPYSGAYFRFAGA